MYKLHVQATCTSYMNIFKMQKVGSGQAAFIVLKLHSLL